MRHPVYVEVYPSHADRCAETCRYRRRKVETRSELERLVHEFGDHWYLAFKKASGATMTGILQARQYVLYQGKDWEFEGVRVYVEKRKKPRWGKVQIFVIRRREDAALLARPERKCGWAGPDWDEWANVFDSKKEAVALASLLDMVVGNRPRKPRL